MGSPGGVTNGVAKDVEVVICAKGTVTVTSVVSVAATVVPASRIVEQGLVPGSYGVVAWSDEVVIEVVLTGS
jgi:hypothetical protein